MVSFASGNVTYTRSATIALMIAAVFSVVVTAFGFVASFAPASMLPPGEVADTATRFMGDLVAVRNIPLGLAAIYVIARRDRINPAAVLILSGVVQFGDTIVGLAHGVASMAAAAGVGAIVYAFAAVYVVNMHHRPS